MSPAAFCNWKSKLSLNELKPQTDCREETVFKKYETIAYSGNELAKTFNENFSLLHCYKMKET